MIAMDLSRNLAIQFSVKSCKVAEVIRGKIRATWVVCITSVHYNISYGLSNLGEVKVKNVGTVIHLA